MRTNFTSFTNFTGSSANATAATQNENGVFRANTATGPRRANANRRDFMRERAEEREREAQIREAENKRIQLLNDRISRNNERIHSVKEQIIALTEEDPVSNYELINDLTREIGQLHSGIDGFSNRIAQIHTARAEREQLAIEREIARQQQEMEERIRERERAAQERNNYENKTEEELEKAAERSNIRNLTTIGVRKENIRALSQTRANLSAAAQRLRGEAGFDTHRNRIANEEIQDFVRNANEVRLERHMVQVERSQEAAKAGIALAVPQWRPMEVGALFGGNALAEDGFRGRHFARLNEGIARTSANIMSQVGAMYRDSQNLQEEQLRIYREKATLPENRREEDDDGNRNENLIDVRL